MNALNLPEPKQTLLNELTARLIEIPGLAALALGGSYAGGTAHAASDLDLGLYYKEEKPSILKPCAPSPARFLPSLPPR
jgi:predicted nucleotidyltransferase